MSGKQAQPISIKKKLTTGPTLKIFVSLNNLSIEMHLNTGSLNNQMFGRFQNNNG